ncbi:hypothetical protein BN946_scf184649.g29 [Trametes cinnabarina]|uniref:AMP-dependent synthetase/ligase domain-containing protein n=1 Tax=Pycnoporus cinnabarinus TaxID=5643 RepID=A0A060SUF4_PYCCI|nr:hypothetical protein BN946_scf184649.g29 [Trametes cinnabarina]
MHYKSLFPPLPPIEDQNVHNFIFNSPALQEPEDKVLLIDPFGGKTWKKNEFKERVYDCATAFLTPESQGGFGFAPEGEMVAIMSPNCLEYFTLVHSLFRVAVPFALIPASSTAFELQHLFRTSEATRVFVHPTLLPQVLGVAQATGLPQDRVYVMDGRVEGRRDVASVIKAVRKRGVSRVESRPVSRTTLAYLVFSSGTSGMPKAVMISHRNVVISLVQAAVAADYEGPVPTLEIIPPVTLGFLPFYHTYGLHYVVIRPVAGVIPTVVLPRWNVEAVLDLIPKYRVSILSLTPPAMLQLVNHPRIRHVDLSSIVLTGSGAAHLPPKVGQAFKRLLKNADHVGEGYGMSEVFRIDEDQHFFFVERAKDILKVSGAQVSPTEIEEVLLAHPDKLILDVTVAGVSGGRTVDEKVPRAWIVLSEEGKRKGETEVVQELHTWVQKNLSKYKWLRGGIEVVDEIPKNPTGKVLRRVLQDRHEKELHNQKAEAEPRAKL